MPKDAAKKPPTEKLSTRKISPEEAKAALTGKNRVHFEGLGDAWGALTGQNPAAVMSQIIGTVLEAGGTRPVWQWERDGKEYVLMAWPQDQPSRAAVLMVGEKGGKLAPVTVAPLLEGLPNDLMVEEARPWERGHLADVAVSMIEGENPLWFFTPLYNRDVEALTPGVTHTFTLAGLAWGLRRAWLDELSITSGPRFEAWAADWLTKNPDKGRLDVPPLKIPLAGKRMIFPGRNFCEYQVRGLVEGVAECALEKMPIKILYMSFPFEDREPLCLPVYASAFVLGDYAPEEGHEVDMYVWLQGRIVDSDGEPA
ncbi:MAG: hypothetical protein LBR31_06740 [Desulfovibrio sp.]|jgi:hypothetical protein|nr:hypothetical protein [Desulfovibrio sp.]